MKNKVTLLLIWDNYQIKSLIDV